MTAGRGDLPDEEPTVMRHLPTRTPQHDLEFRRPGTSRPRAAARPRRGVLLLVVLSLLILFSLIAVTFVLVAGRYYDTARNSVRMEQTGDNPQRLLEDVLAQCVRGTTNPHSVLRGHSLLEDLYGNDGITYSDTTNHLEVMTYSASSWQPIAPDKVGQIIDLRFRPSGSEIKFVSYPGVSLPGLTRLPTRSACSRLKRRAISTAVCSRR